MRATVARLSIASKATLLPRLINDMQQVKMRVSMIALKGTSSRGLMTASHSEYGGPLSRL
jgi:hypothetical protein